MRSALFDRWELGLESKFLQYRPPVPLGKMVPGLRFLSLSKYIRDKAIFRGSCDSSMSQHSQELDQLLA